MLQQDPYIEQPSQSAGSFDRSRLADVAVIVGVVFCALLVEASRRLAFPIPIPFLLLYGTVALAAGYAGRRLGIIAALIVAIFVVHSSLVGYGPPSLTSGPIEVGFGILIGLVIAVLIGDRRDKLIELAQSLEATQRELIDARDVLAQRAERKSDQLEDAKTELVDARVQLENTMLYSPAAVVVVTDKYEITSVNPAGLKVFGLESLPRDWILVERFMQNIRFFAEDGHEFVFGEGPLYQALTQAKVTDDFNCRIVLPDKTERWLRGSFAPIRDLQGTITGVTAIFIDVSEKILSKHQLKDLVSRVLKANEADRSMIAHRLQDDIGQHLVATKINLHSAALTGNFAAPVRDTIKRIDTLMESVRDWSLELRPAALDDLGLVSALRWYLTNQEKNCNYEIDFDVNNVEEALPPDVEIACFRIVQQAVANVLEHADAQSLAVRMYNQDHDLCLAVVDDGCGFEVERAMLGQSDGGGLGLITMRERANQAGGEFAVVSAPGQGTTLTVCFADK